MPRLRPLVDAYAVLAKKVKHLVKGYDWKQGIGLIDGINGYEVVTKASEYNGSVKGNVKRLRKQVRIDDDDVVGFLAWIQGAFHAYGSPAFVLDDTCIMEYDFLRSLMGRIIDINALSNLYFILANEGFRNVKLSYLGGHWVLLEMDSIDAKEKIIKHVGLSVKALTRNTFAKIISSWSELVKIDDSDNSSLSYIRELEAWIPEFITDKEEDSTSNGEFEGANENDIRIDKENEYDHVLETSFAQDHDAEFQKIPKCSRKSVNSEDPFGIYKILKRNKDSPQPTPQFPPGFTPIVEDNVVGSGNSPQPTHVGSQEDGINPDNIMSGNKVNESFVNSKHNHGTKFQASGFILEVMDELIKMNFLSLNVQGLGNKAKQGWIQELNTTHRVNFVAIQETKMENIDLFSIKALWGNLSSNYAFSPSIDYSRGTWIPTSTKLLIISVYAPQDLNERRMLWDFFRHLLDSWDGECVLLGDFNEVHFENERHGSLFNSYGANSFNNFINMMGLIDLPLEGYSFTWSHKSASKMSKLDRFLISEGLLASFPSISALCLDKHLSDHQPIFLRELNVDYGPTSFCFFQSWSSRKGFDKMVEDSWKNSDNMDYNKGDENSKFFHGIINKKHSQLAIRGILVDGDWIVDPSLVKNEFLKHFVNRFATLATECITFASTFPNQLSPDQVIDFESSVAYDEIKHAVWDCGTNKSPGLDGLLPPGCNSSFISLIPKTQEAKMVKDFRPISLIGSMKILDGPFILNELLSWCKHKNSKALIFKIDFEKAFDLVRWDYLDVGNHLSSFLFILIMESLHFSFNKVVNAGLFKGIHIDDSFSLSHLFYADDVIFVGKWNLSNLSTIVNVLKLFHLALGLKINLHKSKLMGIGIPQDVVASAARSIGCSTLRLPFNYLGVKVGGTMSKISSWDDVVAKLSSRLSKWKLKTLSIGGRLTLIKSVLSSLPLYYMSSFKVPISVLKKIESIRRNFFNGVDNAEKKMSLISWKKVLASKKNGGLGVSSFFAMNHALLFKWVWRFIANGSSLWSHFTTTIHGIHGALDCPLSFSKCSPWIDIVREVRKLSIKGIDLLSLIKKLYFLELDKHASVASKLRDNSLFDSFRRPPRGGVEEEQLLLLISDTSTAETCTRWVMYIPIKINIFAWRVSLDKLPSRLNLSLRGLDIPSILCPLCSIVVESTSHLLFACHLARQLMYKVARWWEVEYQDFISYDDWILWLSNLRVTKHFKDVFEGVCYITWWVIWKFRNQVLFGSDLPRVDLLFDEIIRLSFNWCSHRCSLKFDWNSWMKNPSSFNL
ncbi:RNA-directed DNA polymerase, eukaryota [Tanacetum coccineum]